MAKQFNQTIGRIQSIVNTKQRIERLQEEKWRKTVKITAKWGIGNVGERSEQNLRN